MIALIPHLAVLSFIAQRLWTPPAPDATRRHFQPLLQEGGALSKASTQLEQALGALPAGEKYNAVLISLLSKRDGAQQSDTSAM
eukprot:CAMPEP_0174753590 /NCGR_PEP_ID=MMETSP1094-20130205/104317_1 /TAXON_ID=156173 /ORGANISM="Chrysochromulina brevifilum, Strain UTEX LB 985" /LENGTH=83 /DNA_ID=CAMNT_0015959383 /DNA_START=8 /DNA_END=256 /DNA_ORIENTATION=+